MRPFRTPIRAIEDTAAVIAGTAGAVAGATAGAAVGGLGGAYRGAKEGIGIGARSTPAALVTLAAIGAAGLIDWPILLAGGSATLLLRQLRNTNPTPTDTSTGAPDTSIAHPQPTKAANRTIPTPAKPAATRKTATPRKSSTSRGPQ
jgi:hypothetical protein